MELVAGELQVSVLVFVSCMPLFVWFGLPLIAGQGVLANYPSVPYKLNARF
jgi:hypothetical protein